MTLGQRIREARTFKGFKQKDFAVILEIDQSHYSKIERDKVMPTILQITDISKRLDCSLDWLILGKEVQTESVLHDIVIQDDYKERYELAMENIKLLKENKAYMEAEIESLKSKNRSFERHNINAPESKSKLK
ncbi:helix-turn-helix domain-containing protein [Chryseobacterium sp. 2R14A]|uniref:helix-turn-helix domain-containing protein n=1 Tax=Chryseobacterium sp. 2R14A TaxID=3380353 RepID=UPI003CEFB54D